MTITSEITPTVFEIGRHYRVTADKSYHGFRVGTVVRAVSVDGTKEGVLATTWVGEVDIHDWRLGVTAFIRLDEVEETDVFTVEDAEGLRVLPEGTLLRDQDGDTLELDGGKFWVEDELFEFDEIVAALPAQILNPKILEGVPYVEVRPRTGFLPDPEFRIGDRVRVIDAEGDYRAVIGALGTVTHVAQGYETFLYVRQDDGLAIGQYGRRFEKVTEDVVGPVFVFDADGLRALPVGSLIHKLNGDGYRFRVRPGWISDQSDALLFSSARVGSLLGAGAEVIHIPA